MQQHAPSADTLRRLAFIRYMYTVGESQSRQPEPLAAMAVLTFHDSVELFLQLASEYVNRGKRGVNFMEYFPILDDFLAPNRLAQKESMRRLNDSRSSLKHAGTLPSRLDIEGFRASVMSFFTENTPLIFDVNFDAISLIDLVQFTDTKASLKEAATCEEQHEPRQAMEYLTVAFEQLVYDYEQNKSTRRNRSPFLVGEDMTFLASRYLNIQNSVLPGINKEQFADWIDKVTLSIREMQSAIQVLGLGFDYRRYAKFKSLAYSARRKGDGTYVVQMPLYSQFKNPTTLEDCIFCRDFIIDSALRLQEFDFETV